MSGDYSRVYFEVMDDPKFDGIREDVRHFGTWSLMLLVADMAWPASAFMPPVPRASVRLLAERGLVDPLPGGRYRMHGLDAERERRAAAARKGAEASLSSRRASAQRTLSERSANIELDRDEQSKAEQSTNGEAWDGRDDLEAWLLVKHRIPTPRQRQWLDGYCDTFDVTGPQRAAKIILSHPDDPIAALKADRDAFLHERAEAIVVESRPSPHRSGSGLTGVSAELAKLWRQQEEEAEA